MDKEEIKAKKKELMVVYIGEGALLKDAAQMVGISDDTLTRWKKEDAEFAEKVEAAQLEYKHKLTKAVTLNSIRSGKIGLEMLRRRFPKDYNVPNKVRHEGEVNVALKKVEEIVDDLLGDDEPRTKNTEDKDFS